MDQRVFEKIFFEIKFLRDELNQIPQNNKREFLFINYQRLIIIKAIALSI